MISLYVSGYFQYPVNCVSVSMSKLIETVNKSAGLPLILTVLRDDQVLDVTVVPRKVSVINGVEFDGNMVAEVDSEKGGAAVARLQPGDVVTAIGGETSDKGAERFEDEVLSHHPDVITIDYGLNDRRIGLENTEKSLTSMITLAKAQGIKVILLTPTADLNSNLNDPQDPLNKQADLIRTLTRSCNVALIDSLEKFKDYVADGDKFEDLMSQPNHPNRKGHDLVADAIMNWF